MSVLMTSLLLMLLGAAFIAVFAVLNIVVQPKLFPGDRARGASATNPPGHVLLGVVEGVVLLVGVMLVVSGCAMVGTWIGYL
jgi:hypothetical protein